MRLVLAFIVAVMGALVPFQAAGDEIVCKFCDNNNECAKAATWIQYSVSWTDCVSTQRCFIGFCWNTCRGTTACYSTIESAACTELTKPEPTPSMQSEIAQEDTL